MPIINLLQILICESLKNVYKNQASYYQMFNNRQSENLSTYSTEFQNDDITFGFGTKTKLGFRIKSGLAVLIKKFAKEFWKSILNDNGLTRGDAHLAY